MNGTFWVGATLGALAAMFLLHRPGRVGFANAWRYAFGIGGTLGVAVLVLRLYVPESPRWLMLRGYEQQANQVVSRHRKESHPRRSLVRLPAPEGEKLKIRGARSHAATKEIFGNMLGANRKRSFLALVAHGGAGLFSSMLFSLHTDWWSRSSFHVSNDDLPMYLLPFALGSFLGPMLLGRLVRQDWTQADDHRHLWSGRDCCYAGDYLSLRAWIVWEPAD